MLFGALYAGVLAAIAGARLWLDDAGLYFVAGVSGLTDMNAITLSTARLVDDGRLETDPGWRAIVIAAIANLIFKSGLVLALGSRRLFALISTLLGATALVGAALLIWWRSAAWGETSHGAATGEKTLS